MKILNRLLFTLLVSSSLLNSMETEKKSEYFGSSSSVIFPALHEIGSLEWVKEKLKTYSELSWLLDKNVHHTDEPDHDLFLDV